MGTTKTKDQFARFIKSLAGLQIGPENSTPLGPSGAKKSTRLNLSFKVQEEFKMLRRWGT